MTGESLTIRRARLRNTDLDAITARLRLEPQLGAAELRPRGLPPSAVLCIRRLPDPLPGRLELDSGQARPPPQWERAFVDALTRLLETAARPAREAVPANAEAVLFADRAELLACLARDAKDGVAWTRWWWQSLSPVPAPGADPVVAAWLAAPEHVPGALALLAARGEAAAFVGALPVSAAAMLARRIAAVFGAVALERAIAPLAVAPSTGGGARARTARNADRPPEAAVQPPWAAAVPETRAPSLAPAREVLLGVALALRRTPTAARSSAFATATADWLEAPQTEAITDRAAPTPRTPPASEPARPTIVEPPQEDAAIPEAVAPAERAAPLAAPTSSAAPSTDVALRQAPVHSAADVVPSGAVEFVPMRNADDESEPPQPQTAARTTVQQELPEQTRVDAPAEAHETAVPRAQAPSPATPREQPRAAEVADEPAAEEPWEAPALGIETDLGGVFYLLNLFLYLGLYGDFTQPLAPGLALDPWRCVALAGRRLLGNADRGDPVWELLERLAAPSAFRPPRAWRTPRDWLEPFETDEVWRWSAARGTLRLEHPAGFPVVAVPRRNEPARIQLERELRRLRINPDVRRTSLPAEPRRPLARWTARLASYADARLRAALNQPPQVVLRRRARVFVTSTHVDVVLSLSELPLEVRFAGLDRTPGWVPAAGRFVSFHFE